MKTPVFSSAAMFPVEHWTWPNFTPAEMASHDGPLMIDTDAMNCLQTLRTTLGQPMHILSAYRTPDHNAAVGGAPASKHMEAIAFDVSMQGHDPHEFISLARACGFRGIGQYPGKNFVHIDTRPEPAEWNDGANFPFGEDDPTYRTVPVETPAPAPEYGKVRIARGRRTFSRVKARA